MTDLHTPDPAEGCPGCRDLLDAYHRQRTRAERAEEVIASTPNGKGRQEYFDRINDLMDKAGVEGFLIIDRVETLISQRNAARQTCQEQSDLLTARAEKVAS